jgi:hypothetical protein
MTEQVTYHRDSLSITLEIGSATALMGMERSLLRGEADKAAGEPRAAQVLHRYLYPDLVACVVKAEGLPWPPSFEAFSQLPDELVARWERGCYAANPHWQPGYQDEEAAEKKAPSSGAG